ncbi:cyclic nucleotide-binding domain-containing protein [Actinomadura madurae]|uniref:Crp/Fnr family transcriptional regulator n=1 Tax=Actinomadura madurae TaxID=1993 RepID=UPI0020D25EC9|nr:cyclic nucleotide-binding domain-containing protein [Actinomadura madurae]MCP9951402.1 cyclic nucleotide-binding domain-containing protein [Actinomadura madurae]
MNDHARDHDPDQIVNSELMPRPRTARPAETARRQGFWPSLTTIEQAAFLASAREVVYPVGAVLWAEGQSADQTIVIKSGSVRVSVERDGRERIIAFRGPGDILGERAALMLRRRSATVVAMDTLHALLLSTQEFVAYLSDHPRVVAVLEHEMYDRMTEQHGSAQPPQYATGPMHPYGPAAQYGPPQPYASAYMPVLPHYQYAMTGPFTVAGAYAVPDPRTGGAAYLTNAPMTNAPMTNAPMTNAPLPAHTIGAVVEASYEQPTQPMDIPRRKGASWAARTAPSCTPTSPGSVPRAATTPTGSTCAAPCTGPSRRPSKTPASPGTAATSKTAATARSSSSRRRSRPPR